MVASEVALDTPAAKDDIDTDAVVDETCSVCGHPMRAHDAIGTRFCAATMTGSLNRGCVCQP